MLNSQPWVKCVVSLVGAHAKGCQTIVFQQNLLKDWLNMVIAGVLFEDNHGCIHLIRNQKTGGRTKHIDVRHFFCRELCEKKLVLPCCARSEENMADGMTKNQPEALHAKHEAHMMGGQLPHRKEDVELALLGLVEDSVD